MVSKLAEAGIKCNKERGNASGMILILIGRDPILAKC